MTAVFGGGSFHRMEHAAEELASCSREEILAQFERIITSGDFDPTLRSQEFLRYIIELTLSGHSSEISQYAIATQVFGRSEQFDPSADPIVRIQASRLRRSLDHYYLSSGAQDPVKITVPKGGYQPEFQRREITAEPSSQEDASRDVDEALSEAGNWPAILITPFRYLTDDPQQDYLGQGIATELGIELDRYQLVRVYVQPQVSSGIPADPAIRFRIEGSLETRGSALVVLLTLVDNASGVQIWGRQFRCGLDDANLNEFLDEVALAVAAALADERGVIMRHMLRERHHHPRTPGGSHDAILRFYHFNSHPSAENLPQVIEALRNALKSDPDRGLLWTLLARMYALNHSLRLLDLDTPIADARRFALTGVRLEPDSQRAHGVLAYVFLLTDELDAGRRETRAAIKLNPNSLVFAASLGYLLTLLGDWDRGGALLDKATRLNPYYHPTTHHALWLNHLRLEQFEAALQQAIATGDHGSFWAPLTRAVSHALLGQLKRAREETRLMLQVKPDFADDWRWLVTRYVKFEPIVETIRSGLERAGLELPET